MNVKLKIPKIPLKPVLLYGLLLLGLFVLTGILLIHNRQIMMEQRQQTVRQMVDNVYNLVEFYYAEEVLDNLPENDAKNYALMAMRALPSYDANSYCWINDMQGVMIMHPIIPELNGKNLLEFKDPNGTYLFKDFIKTVQTKQEGFVNYMWPKPDEPKDKSFPKLSYVKGFEAWGWIIGSGIYIDDVDKAFWQSVHVIGGLVVAVLLFIVALFFTFSEGLKKP